MDRWRGKIALIAGASDGIGAQIVKHLLKEEIIVVGIARRKEKIEELSTSKNLHALKVDVTMEEEVLKAFKWVQNNLGPIHILVNAIGTLWYGNLSDSQSNIWKEMYESDVFGLFLLSREAIKNMRENNVDGHIIHISGISGQYSDAQNVSVLVSKNCAIASAIESLRKELVATGSKIKISSVSPGLVATNIFHKNIQRQLEFKEIADSLKEDKVTLSTSDVADSVIYILSTPPRVQVHNIQIRAVGSLI